MKIVLILPSLVSGGLEKVITELAWFFHRQDGIKVYFISLSKGELFYSLPADMRIYMPSFGIGHSFRAFSLIRLMCWLRMKVKSFDPDILLSFGGKFNAFVALSVAGLPVKVFVSDRSKPSISYGWLLDWLNPLVYKRVNGIVAQTEKAKSLMVQRIGHSNIRVIGNPIKTNHTQINTYDKVILNVGRFVFTKQQELLVKYFAQINPKGWTLCFVGGGPLLNKIKGLVSELGIEDRVVFEGEVSVVEEQYYRSSIFAFTSISEGFPNVLGEAMAAKLACISFDCEAGPSDLIEDGKNGILIQENDHEAYIKKLDLLIKNEMLRKEFGENAREKVLKFSTEQIGEQFLDFFHHSLYEDYN